MLARNWRVREGEIDLVARRDATIVFCEVKTRRGNAFGIPAEAVTPRKRARLRMLAVRWLGDNQVRADVLRFDVASVTRDQRGAWIVDVLEAAF
jgi:putative endonuclease